MKILRLNMTDRTFHLEEVPSAYKNMGGRWLTSSIVAAEVPPLAHPLGPANKIVFAPGILTGTTAPTSSRVSVGGKSPLTGGIKESNAGAAWAHDLASMQIKAVVVEGQPDEKDRYWGAHLTWDNRAGTPKVDFFNATEYADKSLYDVFPKLYQRFGEKVSVAVCGIAGERGYGNAGVVFNDIAKRPSRYAGRGGLGSVLGSKRLKFIIVNDAGSPGAAVADGALFEQGRKKMVDALQTHAITKPKGALNTYGTAVLVNILNEAGGLPTRNFTSGRFEGAGKIAGEAIFEGNKQRLGKELYNHACSPGCIIQCSNTWHKANGKEHVSCVEYESDWSMGANCGIDNLDDIAEMVRLCNGYGLDTIETGATLAVAMAAGVIPFGDGKGAIRLVREIGKGTPMGRILGSGTETTGRVFGLTHVPVVKGQSMPAYDPRAIKGIGITYATSTMGADHTSGYTICPEILSVGGKSDPLSPEGKAALSRGFQATTAFIDATGHCLFIAFAILDIASGYDGMIEECNGVLGTKWTADDVLKIGGNILKMERAFNEGAGFTEMHDRLPEFMRKEPLPPHNAVFDVPDSALDSVYAEL
jgi:aldehyde:ferredoxin oxidoreductase